MKKILFLLLLIIFAFASLLLYRLLPDLKVWYLGYAIERSVESKGFTDFHDIDYEDFFVKVQMIYNDFIPEPIEKNISERKSLFSKGNFIIELYFSSGEQLDVSGYYRNNCFFITSICPPF